MISAPASSEPVKRFNLVDLRRLLGTALCACVYVMMASSHAQTSAAAPKDSVANPPKLSLCYERAEIRPWRRTDDSGLNFDLLRAAALQARVTVDFVNLPWKRCLAQLQDNAVDGVFAASFNAERLAVGAFPGGQVPDVTRRLHTDRYVLVRRKGDSVTWDGKQLSSLKGPVGAQLGYSIVRQLQALGVQVDDGSHTATELLRKLPAGRLGAAGIGGRDAAGLLGDGSAFAKELEMLPVALDEKAYYLMLSHRLLREQPQVADRLWTAIGQVRQSADYRKAERAAMAAMQP